MKDSRTGFERAAVVGFALLLCVYVGAACDGTGVIPDPVGTDDGMAVVTVTLKASFGADMAAKPKSISAKELCPAAPTAADSSMYQGEQDCDGDGGIIRYITPSVYKVAFKRLAFENADGDLVDVIADTGTLADAQVLDLTTEVTLSVLDFPVAEYPVYYAEIYYHELTMPLYDPVDPDTIRVYVSDDNFPGEGSLGHHQGDITLLDDDGNELGFVPAGNLWQIAFLQATRGSINGAGGVDSETGHLRGLYGDPDLWNRSEAMQGSNQDIFILEGDLDLVVQGTGSAVTFSFDVQDAWFFEDFDNDQWFNPCEGGTLDGCGGEWSPVFDDPVVVVE